MGYYVPSPFKESLIRIQFIKIYPHFLRTRGHLRRIGMNIDGLWGQVDRVDELVHLQYFFCSAC